MKRYTIADRLRANICGLFRKYADRKPQSCLPGSPCNCTDLQEAAAELDRLSECNKSLHGSGAHEHYQPQIDECIREINVLRELLGRFGEFERDADGYCDWCGAGRVGGNLQEHTRDCIYPEVRAALAVHKPNSAQHNPTTKGTTMREITEHRVNPANDTIKITVLDEPGAGGANHHYMVTLPDWTRAPDGSDAKGVWDIQFQNGPIAENGVNGITQEVLLAIVADRLRSFQAGPYACEENGDALAHVESAQRRLQDRTKARMARGVEGTGTA